MDTDRQLHELDATGWRRGLYDDVKRTFRAPFVNWIFRTAVANEPGVTRQVWSGLKPLFGTRAFARLTVAFRDAVLSSLGDLPCYRRPATGLAPAEYRELRGQMATFDVLAPRLAVLFEAADRALGDGERTVGADPATDAAATAPFPRRLDRDRGRAPTMADGVPEAARDAVEGVRACHGLDPDGGLPSVYRCLVQWPEFFDRLWADLEPTLTGDGFDRAGARTAELVDGFLDAAPYRPALSPATLRDQGFDRASVEALGALFARFNRRPIRSVLVALPAYAATVGSEGRRWL